MTKRYLTDKQLKQFEEDGFVVCSGMYSADEMKLLSDWVDEIVARPPEIGRQMVYLEDSRTEKGKRILSRIEKFADYHEKLNEFIHAEKMIGRASEILGEPAVLFKEKINFKLPGAGGFAPHQDIQPGWDDYCPFFISVLVTIDESNEANGCLELSSGFHKKGLLGEKWKPLEGEQLAGIEFVKYPMQPGDVAFFVCFVPHKSEPNMTSKQRRNLYLTYNRQSDGDHREQYYADKRKSYPPDYERETGKEYTFRV